MNTEQLRIKALDNACSHLVGLECWGVVAGRGRGSRVSLKFGQKIKRKRPIANPNLDEAVRNFESDRSIFIKDCAWRLNAEDQMLCGWRSDNRKDGELLTGLKKLLNSQVASIRLARPGLDLTVTFTNGLTLSIFADCTDAKTDGDNYSVFDAPIVFTVGPRGLVRFEESSRI